MQLWVGVLPHCWLHNEARGAGDLFTALFAPHLSPLTFFFYPGASAVVSFLIGATRGASRPVENALSL